MLTIEIPGEELFNEETNEFYNTSPVTLQMEHSLISISKWESKWHKAFLTNKKRTPEETLDYFRCMTINKVKPEVFDRLSIENIEEITTYINEPMTAVYMGNFSRGNTGGGKASRDVTTSEVLYYYMISLGIPFECEKWHLNRLLALIHVCEVKNSSGSQKMSRAQLNRRNASLNAARRKAHGTKG